MNSLFTQNFLNAAGNYNNIVQMNDIEMGELLLLALMKTSSTSSQHRGSGGQNSYTFNLRDITSGIRNHFELIKQRNASPNSGPIFHRFDEKSDPVLDRTIMEGFGWLLSQNLIALSAADLSYHCITRRGIMVANSIGQKSIQSFTIIPKDQVHEYLHDNALSDFSRGDFSGAIFKATRSVEVAVRKSGDYPQTDVGVNLMRRAFNPENGPLRDERIPSAEREAIANLFAGVIGAYKNPHSHREGEHNDPDIARQVIYTCSLLLDIVHKNSAQDVP